MSFDSYIPLQSGAHEGLAKNVYYHEQKAPALLADIVHCFWTLKTMKPLREDFIYTVMPDACIDFVFDVTGKTAPIAMTPTVAIETLHLGKVFHYVGIRFKPGVFKNSTITKSLIGSQKDVASILEKRIELDEIRLSARQSEREHYTTLEECADQLIDAGIIERNRLIENVLRGMQYGLSVDQVANKVGYSARQLRRKVLTQSGYSPVQLRRIVRFQSVLSSGEYELRFSDQSHLIKEFKAVTGVSYATFARKYIDVRKVQSLQQR